MTIEKYISSLLYRYQCVIVPGFGAFLSQAGSARLEPATNTIYPPKKFISFNANLKNNDGLLANHIALQEKISYDAAVQGIAGVVQQWRQRLQNGDSLVFKSLGELYTNAEGTLVFTPDNHTNYLTEAFGLSPVVSPVIKREVYKEQAEVIEEKAPIVFTPARKRSYSYLKYAAVFAVMAGVGATAFVNYRNGEIAAQTLQVEKDVQQGVQQKIAEASFFIDTLPAVTLPLKAELAKPKPYHIVAGAYRSLGNAKYAMNGLKALGYKAEILDKNRFNLYPVIYGSYATSAEANKNLHIIQNKHNREAWLMVEE
ncbi:HU domain-containing protein [Flavobacterium rhizosphaerae]|uniref:SPOR domain-containing protein n=1 Tax=Flavobacterium rhizosphaerae TaxID=3163298 RepID=A0ABW8YXA0_9FLAO